MVVEEIGHGTGLKVSARLCLTCHGKEAERGLMASYLEEIFAVFSEVGMP